jgi:hypothetical protein
MTIYQSDQDSKKQLEGKYIVHSYKKKIRSRFFKHDMGVHYIYVTSGSCWSFGSFEETVARYNFMQKSLLTGQMDITV